MSVSSNNSTWFYLEVSNSGSDMSSEAWKSVKYELALCRMRNPIVTQIYAQAVIQTGHDSIKICKALRYFLRFCDDCICINHCRICFFASTISIVHPCLFDRNSFSAAKTSRCSNWSSLATWLMIWGLNWLVLLWCTSQSIQKCLLWIFLLTFGVFMLISTNTALTYLNLEANQISDAGAISIGTGIRCVSISPPKFVNPWLSQSNWRCQSLRNWCWPHVSCFCFLRFRSNIFSVFCFYLFFLA